jgi:hypothetical protein
MNKDELNIYIQKIPLDRKGTEKNIYLLLQHARYIETISDVNDPMAKGLLEVVPAYLRKQIERLQRFLDDEPDMVSWISRNLMELFFTLRYMYSSRERYDEVIKEQLKDLKEIEGVLYPSGSPSQDVPEQVKTFHSDMKTMWEALENYGIRRDDLKRPQTVRYFAEGANLLHEYNRGWRIHSKYAHPTSYLLFGKKNFVYGNDARSFFWIMAQYYAAWNLRDLHGMIEAAMVHKNGT